MKEQPDIRASVFEKLVEELTEEFMNRKLTDDIFQKSLRSKIRERGYPPTDDNVQKVLTAMRTDDRFREILRNVTAEGLRIADRSTEEMLDILRDRLLTT